METLWLCTTAGAWRGRGGLKAAGDGQGATSGRRILSSEFTKNGPPGQRGQGRRPSSADVDALRGALDALEQPGQYAPRADLVKPLHARVQQVAQRLLPQHRL